MLQSMVLQRVAVTKQLNNSRIIHFSKKLRHNFQDDTQRKNINSLLMHPFLLLLKQDFPYLNMTFLKCVNCNLFLCVCFHLREVY